MNENKTNFEMMVQMLYDLQTSIITVEWLEEKFWERPALTKHIIIPDGKDKVTDFMFVCANKTNFLASVHSLDMSFEDAITEFSRRTLRCQGAVFKLTSL